MTIVHNFRGCNHKNDTIIEMDEQQGQNQPSEQPHVIEPQFNQQIVPGPSENPSPTPDSADAPATPVIESTPGPPVQPPEPAETPVPPQQTEQSSSPPQDQEDESKQWGYQSGQLEASGGYTQQGQDQKPATSGDAITWNASEFVDHDKTGNWFLALIGAAVAVDVIIYLVTRDVFSVAVIALLTIAVALFSKIKPRTLDYAISGDGIQVGNRHFPYLDFKSFSVVEENRLPSIVLLPHKRFMMPITMFLDPSEADKIIEVLGEYLPFERQELDFIDRLSSKLRF